jgi:serine/threonine protein kinase
MTKTFLGTPAYLPPEIVKKEHHNQMVDWYHLGVLIYEMLIGITPFYHDDKETLFKNISSAELKIPKFLSEEAKDLIT